MFSLSQVNSALYLGLSVLPTIHDTGATRVIDGKRQKFNAEARRILSRFEGRPIEERDVAREAQGRPFFPGKAADFNIAHSGDLLAVSYTRGENLRTGCDLEQIRPRARAREIAEDYFSSPEKDYISPQGRFGEARFYAIWTLKECFLKLRGGAVFDMAACPSFLDDEEKFTFGASVSSPLSFCLYELSGSAAERYILAVAIEGTEQTHAEIQWFSQGSLDCKKIAEIKAAPSPAETVSPKI